MPAGGGNFQRPLDVLLAHNLGEVWAGLAAPLGGPGWGGRNLLAALQVVQQVAYRFHRIHGGPLGQGCLGGVFCRDIEHTHPRAGSGHRHGQDAGNRPQRAGQGQLPHKGSLRRRGLHHTLGGEDAQKDGQIIDCALLTQGRRGQVDGDAGDREFRAAGLDGSAYTLPGLLDCRVRQAHHVKGGQSAGQRALHGDLVPCDALQSQGADQSDHSSSFLRCRVLAGRRGHGSSNI